jgi:hypothetical protein
MIGAFPMLSTRKAPIPSAAFTMSLSATQSGFSPPFAGPCFPRPPRLRLLPHRGRSRLGLEGFFPFRLGLQLPSRRSQGHLQPSLPSHPLAPREGGG